MEDFESQYEVVKEETELRAIKLSQYLLKAGREDDLFKASENAKYREELYVEFGL